MQLTLWRTTTNLIACNGPKTTDNCPLPGDSLTGLDDEGNRRKFTVVASVIYREADDELNQDRFTLLLITEASPYFAVAVVAIEDGLWWGAAGAYDVEHVETHMNIVPASLAYQDWGGDY